ncbi:transporter substrate-binding domain-containing protein [Shewanella rhizosphaerae]|uniref:substrate-binding periplasmic protein n=1 Tax=Shewanella rhizosphaerae TaxID=2864207 RepID=UPI001C65DB67|nr:transporter substrate-binding domain-containing protein [Shewanella rhizosphaerae]QYK14368.1 transporter substrate-binding domain-containing protein [Shewanella rhizosphaerae]
MRISLAFISCLMLAAPLRAETVLSYDVNGSSSWYPYFIPETTKDPGILAELVPQIFALTPVRLDAKHYPPKRTNQALATGGLDFDVVSPSWFEGGELGDAFVQSQPIFAIKEHVVVLAGNQEQWMDINKIRGQEIGTVRGYLYHDDSEYTRIDFKSERELIIALQKGRIQAAIAGDLTALYWAKELEVPIALAAVHSDGVLVIRLRKEHQALLGQINHAISLLRSQGVIDALLAKYTSGQSVASRLSK